MMGNFLQSPKTYSEFAELRYIKLQEDLMYKNNMQQVDNWLMFKIDDEQLKDNIIIDSKEIVPVPTHDGTGEIRGVR